MLCPEGSLNTAFDFLQGAQISCGSKISHFLLAVFVGDFKTHRRSMIEPAAPRDG